MKNLSLDKKILLYLSLAALVTNPVTGSMVLEAIEAFFVQAFRFGPYIGVIYTAYLVLWLVWMNHKHEKPNIPAKSKKTRTQPFIAT